MKILAWIMVVIFSIFLHEPLAFAGEISDEYILKMFELIPEPSCKKIRVKEPDPPVNSIWYARHYLTIDGGKNCQIHQFAVYWMSNRIEDVRKYTESILYRYENGRWIEEYGLEYIPKIRIRNKINNRVYLIVERNIDEYREGQIAYYSGSWNEVRTYPGKYGIHTLWGYCVPTAECRREEEVVERAVKLLTPNK